VCTLSGPWGENNTSFRRFQAGGGARFLVRIILILHRASNRIIDVSWRTSVSSTKRQTNSGICPVCGKKAILMEQEALSRDRIKVPWFCIYEDILSSIEEGKGADPHSDRKIIHWACNNCIRNGKAIFADSHKQKFCDCYPYLAYFDEQRKCQQCGTKYTFDKAEQKHWYEELQFWVQSRPKSCKECYRKGHREVKE
jgi:hypothetical protein